MWSRVNVLSFSTQRVRTYIDFFFCCFLWTVTKQNKKKLKYIVFVYVKFCLKIYQVLLCCLALAVCISLSEGKGTGVSERLIEWVGGCFGVGWTGSSQVGCLTPWHPKGRRGSQFSHFSIQVVNTVWLECQKTCWTPAIAQRTKSPRACNVFRPNVSLRYTWKRKKGLVQPATSTRISTSSKDLRVKFFF